MEPHPYRQAFADRDLEGVVALLADDVVFHSPVISAPGFEGRASVAELHTMIFDALGDIEYTHEFSDDSAHAEGKIREIWIMVRPLAGAVAIAEAIGSRLTQRQAPRRARAGRAVSKALAALAGLLDRNGARMIGGLNRSAG